MMNAAVPEPKAPPGRRLWALIPCAGTGSRAGADGPKQYQLVAGRPLVLHTLAAFAAVRRLAGVQIVVSSGDTFWLDHTDATVFVAPCGGFTRAESVFNGLTALQARGAQAQDWVLVHDAARCLITPQQIDTLIDACLDDPVGGLLALPLPDTLKQEAGGRVAQTLERADKWLAQTPFMGTAKSNTQLSLNRVLSLKHYGWHDFADTIMFAKAEEVKYPKPILLLDHGTRVKSGAVKSAASQFNSFGAVSYIQGHVHRLGVGYQRTLHGQHCLAEGGTLRDITPEYLKYPDWANGLLHFVVDKDVVTITPILIENGVAYIGNTKV